MTRIKEEIWIKKFFAPPPISGRRPQRALRRFFPKAAKQRDLYSEALRFATERLKNPEVRRFFNARRRSEQSTFTAAVDIYIQFHCPFDPSNYYLSEN